MKHRASLPVVRLLVALALAAGLGLAHSRPASAASPCWKTLLNDLYDGRIDGTYPAACYRAALTHLPTDVELYSNAKAEITAAMRERVLGGGSKSDRAIQSSSGRTNGPVKRALTRIGSSDATSVPVALVVLAAVALVLVSAGVAQELVLRRGRRRSALGGNARRES